MSVLVRNMKMPETCEGCNFHRYHSHNEYVCAATPLFYPMNLANSEGIRKDFCPLVEMPEKHGRLFDTDEVVKCLEELPDCNEKAWAIGLLEWAIAKRWCIEAEGEG